MAEEAVATPVGNGAADGKPKKKKHKLSFPTAFTILFVITILAVIATWFNRNVVYSRGRLFQGRLRRRLGRVPDHRARWKRSYY